MSTRLPTRPPKFESVNVPRFAIVASEYNPEFVQGLVNNTCRELYKIEERSAVELFSAPGSFEIPVVADMVASLRRHDVVIALGVLLQGKTRHADLIAESVANANARIRFFRIAFGAGGLALGFTALGLAPPSFALTMALLSASGLVAGFYIIPLQSMLQSLAPDDSRGRVLGTANGMSFVMGGAGSVLFLALRQLGMPSNRVFLVLAGACAAMAVVAARRARGQASSESTSP
jgi:hypothetical protein